MLFDCVKKFILCLGFGFSLYDYSTVFLYSLDFLMFKDPFSMLISIDDIFIYISQVSASMLRSKMFNRRFLKVLKLFPSQISDLV